MNHDNARTIAKPLWAIAGLTFLGLGWYLLAVLPFLGWFTLAYRSYKERNNA